MPQEPRRNPALVGAAGTVFANTGELHWTWIDLSAPVADGREIGLSWRRTYRSQSTDDGPLGVGWTHTYNVRLLASGADRDLIDENGRHNLFTWSGTAFASPPGMYATLVHDAVAAEYVLTDRTGFRRVFDATGAGPYRLKRIVNVYGRELQMNYDPMGKLIAVVDTFGRTLAIAYDGTRIASISDWAGRSVAYAYGPTGRLERSSGIPTPQVPAGRAQSYIYAPGSDAFLRIIQIRDAKGAALLDVSYDASTRVWSQRLGGATQQFTLTYAPLVTTQEDPAGNEINFLLSPTGHVVQRTEHTRGLRPTDPPTYVTTYEYAASGECTRIVMPVGNELLFDYDTAAPDARRRGNLLRVRRVSSNPADPVLQATFEYESLFNQVRLATDWRGYQTRYWYDYEEATAGDLNGDGITSQAFGNLVRIDYPTVSLGQPAAQTASKLFAYRSDGRIISESDPEGHVTEYDYYSSPSPSAGRMSAVTLDSLGLALRRTLEYDLVGRVDAYSDARGNVYRLDVDPAGRVTRIVEPQPFEFETHLMYDANGQLARVRRENFRSDGNLDTLHPFITTRRDYDALGNLTVKTVEPHLGTELATLYSYDALGRLVETETPLGIRTTRQYDERGLLWKLTTAVGLPEEAMTTYDYTLNGRIARIVSPTGLVTTCQYDGFHRLTDKQLPSGAVRHLGYDAADRTTLLEDRDASATVLSSETFFFDERGRLYRIEQLHDDSAGAPVGDGIAVTQLLRNRDGLVTSMTDDQGGVQTFAYDGGHRRISKTSELGAALGDQTNWDHDADGRVVEQEVRTYNQRTTVIDVSRTVHAYDELGRRTTTTRDPGGSAEAITQYAYNSLRWLTSVTNPAGIVDSTDFDGNGRPVTRSRALGPQAVVLELSWDDDGRLAAARGPNGFANAYTWDPLGRLLGVTFADGTQRTFERDLEGRTTAASYPTGTTVTMMYSATSGLLTQKSIVRGPGVLGETLVTYGYDGAGRLDEMENSEGGTTIARWESALDTLLNQDRERLKIGSDPMTEVQRGFNNLLERIQVVYPVGGTFDATFDLQKRLQDVSGGGTTVVEYQFSGWQPVTRTGQCAVETRLTADALRRVTEYAHYASYPTAVAGSREGYDDRSLRTFQESVSEGVGAAFEYDDLNRVEGAKYGVPSADLVAGKPYSDYTTYSVEERFEFDGASNRVLRTLGAAATHYNVILGSHVPDPTNRYVQIDSIARTHDASGNLTGDGVRTYAYDHANRLVEVRFASTGAVVAKMSYDPCGRLVTIEGSAPATLRKLYWDGRRCIEERDSAGSLIAAYVYGRGLDEIAAADVVGTRYFLLQDSLGSVVAIANAAGTVLERVRYDVYGTPTYTNAAWVPLADPTRSALGVPFAYRGARWLPDVGLYYMRARYYDPATGRFVTRDPLADPLMLENLLNGYTYCSADPVNRVDALGLYGGSTHSEITEDALNQLAEKTKERLDAEDYLVCQVVNADYDGVEVIAEQVVPLDYFQKKHGMNDLDKAAEYALEKFEESKKHLANGNPAAGYQAMGDALHTIQDMYAHHGMGKIEHYLRDAAGAIVTLFGLLGANPFDPHDEGSIPDATAATLAWLQSWYTWLVHYGYKPNMTPVCDQSMCVIDDYGSVHLGEDDEAHPVSFDGGSCGLSESPSPPDLRDWRCGSSVVSIPFETQFIGVVGSEGIGLRVLESIEMAQAGTYAPVYRIDLPFGIMTSDVMSRYGQELNLRDFT
jgi:RHS repeat-associated protein